MNTYEHASQASYYSPVSIARLMLTASIRADVVPPAINPTRSPCSPSLINTNACKHQTRLLCSLVHSQVALC